MPRVIVHRVRTPQLLKIVQTMTTRQEIAKTIDEEGIEHRSIVDNVNYEREDAVVSYPRGHNCRIHNKEEMGCYFVVDDVAVVACFDQEHRLVLILAFVSVPTTNRRISILSSERFRSKMKIYFDTHIHRIKAVRRKWFQFFKVNQNRSWFNQIYLIIIQLFASSTVASICFYSSTYLVIS